VSQPRTAGQIKANKTGVVQKLLDDQARVLGYESINIAITFADEPAVPKFQKKGRHCALGVAWYGKGQMSCSVTWTASL
jgi:hypothetical protein